MLAKNRSGWTLMEYIDIREDDIDRYPNVTGAYAILRVADKYVVGYNAWRRQWRPEDSRRGKEKTPKNEREDRTDSAIMGNGNPGAVADLYHGLGSQSFLCNESV